MRDAKSKHIDEDIREAIQEGIGWSESARSIAKSTGVSQYIVIREDGLAVRRRRGRVLQPYQLLPAGEARQLVSAQRARSADAAVAAGVLGIRRVLSDEVMLRPSFMRYAVEH